MSCGAALVMRDVVAEETLRGAILLIFLVAGAGCFRLLRVWVTPR